MAGSAAAALTGLMFVVITLVSGERRSRSSEGISTFSTPTVVHFSAALFISALLIAPWPALAQPAALLVLVGVFGVFYMAVLMYRARRLNDYQPDLEDWACYTILPFVAYGAVLAAGIMLQFVAAKALFALAAGVLLLIFIGIHNAWDIVTFLAVKAPAEPPSSS